MATCAIVNPNAGSVEDLEHLHRALQRLGACEMFETQAAGDGSRLAREAAAGGFGQVLAVGGDGTVSEVVNGLGPDFGGVRLGVIPLGTGNDFARSLAVPHDMDAAIEVVQAGRTLRVDVGQITHRERTWFANTSGLGFVTLLNENVAAGSKDWWGRWAYFWAGLKTLPQVPEYEVTLALDDLERLEIRAYNIMVCNGRYVGGGIEIAPQALIDDGMAEIVIVPALSLPKLPALFARLVQGEPQQLDDLVVRRARRVRVEARPVMPFNVDGEPTGETPVEYEVLPQVLEVFVGDGALAR